MHALEPFSTDSFFSSKPNKSLVSPLQRSMTIRSMRPYTAVDVTALLIHFMSVRYFIISRAAPLRRTRRKSLSTRTVIITVGRFRAPRLRPTLLIEADIVYSVSPIDFNGRNGSIVEFRDVTEEKTIERERLNALLMNEQQSTRIQESEVHKANMASFVSFVCHELRNPLQGVTSGAEFLTETLEKLDLLTATLSSPGPLVDDDHDSNISNAAGQSAGTLSSGLVEPPTLVAMQGLISYAKELVSNIATCASHQALITNNVLDLSRLDAGKVEPSFDVIDIHALGRQAVGMMTARAHAKSIDLVLANPSNAPLYVQADATILSQVLLNLISNAVKVCL